MPGRDSHIKTMGLLVLFFRVKIYKVPKYGMITIAIIKGALF